MSHEDYIISAIEKARRLRGVSIAELARRVGVDRRRLWHVLRKRRAMRADELVRICLVPEISLESLMSPDRHGL